MTAMIRWLWMVGLVSVLVGCGPEQDDPAQAGDATGTTGSGDAESTSEGGTEGPISPNCSDVTFAQSVQLWDSLVSEQGSTYYMRVVDRDSGPFGEPLENGCMRTYTLQVIDGAPASRSMVAEPFGAQESCEPGWEEEGGALGSNEAPLQPWTMEMHYEACEQEVLSQDPEENSITLCTFEVGVLAHCSYFPTNCADGCSTGPEGYASGIDFDEVGFGLAP